ncbi:MAG: efflux RND transporter periplasmic adaptor subunit [Pseudomonadota bacterium]
MPTIKLRLILAFALTWLVYSCGEPDKPVPPILEIPVVKVIYQDVPIYIEMIGQTYGSRDIPIRARVDGTLETMHFEEGRNVKKDQLLYTIDTRPFDAKVVEAEGGVSEALTALTKAKSDLERIEPLAKMNAVSQQDLDSAQAEYEAAQSGLQVAKARLEQANIELGYTKIFAPISGRIGLTNAEIGEYVGKDPNPVILNYVSQTDPIRVRFSVNERDYLRFARSLVGKTDRQKEIDNKNKDPLKLILADGTEYEYPGQITSYEAAINPTTGTLTLEADFPNPDSLIIAGQFARLIGVVEVREDATLIPQKSVTELQGNFQVMVVDNEGIVNVRKVTLGPHYENLVIVESGLKVGEQVAVEGILKLRNGMQVKPVPASSN